MKPIRIISISVGVGYPTVKESFKARILKAEELIHQAGWGCPDIIALPELFAHDAFPLEEWKNRADDYKGETICRFKRLAKDMHCMIICPILLRHESQTFNSVVFISKDGEIIKSYSKRYPTIEELNAGIYAGTESHVFDASMVRLGVLVCFDLNFIEIHRAIREQRPQIIFFHSMFRGGLRLRYLALECASYVVGVVSTSNQLINPLGRLLNKAGSRQESFQWLPQYLEEMVNANYGVYHLDGNMDHLQEIRNKYAGRVHLEVAQGEAVFLLESLDPELAIDEVEKCFRLERSLDYFDRARARADTSRRD